jgi:adenylate kinase family enzyme
MTAPVIVVSGLPASGKTTLTRRLSAALRLPLLSLDTIKEAIVDEITVEDRFAVRSAAREIVARLVQDSPAGCLVDIWVNPVRDTRDVTERLGTIAGVRYLEVVCRVPTEQAVERYADRTRHPAHLAAGDDDALTRIREAGPRIASLGLGPAYDVDTSDQSDAEAQLAGVLDWLARHEVHAPPARQVS